MAQKKVYGGSTVGPLLYDDSIALDDVDGDFSGLDYHAVVTDGQLIVEAAPTLDAHVMRKVDGVSAHTHDGDTLQCDDITSDGGDHFDLTHDTAIWLNANSNIIKLDTSGNTEFPGDVTLTAGKVDIDRTVGAGDLGALNVSQSIREGNQLYIHQSEALDLPATDDGSNFSHCVAILAERTGGDEHRRALHVRQSVTGTSNSIAEMNVGIKGECHLFGGEGSVFGMAAQAWVHSGATEADASCIGMEINTLVDTGQTIDKIGLNIIDQAAGTGGASGGISSAIRVDATGSGSGYAHTIYSVGDIKISTGSYYTNLSSSDGDFYLYSGVYEGSGDQSAAKLRCRDGGNAIQFGWKNGAITFKIDSTVVCHIDDAQGTPALVTGDHA